MAFNNKGQIFSLDFILAFALITLAIGLSLGLFETQSLNAKEQQNRQDTWLAAKTASDMLTNNPEINCRLVTSTSTEIDSLPNCLPKQISLSKQKLGIQQGTNCFIQEVGTNNLTIQPNPCNTQPANQANTFSIDRQIVVMTTQQANADITKKQLKNCQDNDPNTSCDLSQATIRVTVWN